MMGVRSGQCWEAFNKLDTNTHNYSTYRRKEREAIRGNISKNRNKATAQGVASFSLRVIFNMFFSTGLVGFL